MKEREYAILYPTGGVSCFVGVESEIMEIFKAKKTHSPQATLWRKVDLDKVDDSDRFLVLYPGGGRQGFRVNKVEIVDIFAQRRIASPQATLWCQVEINEK